MVKLSILLLGAPEIYWGDQKIVLQNRTTRALLFYLASQGGMSTHEELRSLFWKANSHQRGLHLLKNSIEELVQALPDPLLILSRRDRLGLEPNRLYLDQQDFQGLIDQAGHTPWQIPSNQPLPEDIAALFFKAAGLWRSPHYLDGVELPTVPAAIDWLQRSAEKMERLYSRVAGRLAEHSYAVGQVGQALRYIRLALIQDKYNDQLHTFYLRLLIESDRRAEAADYFRRLESSLRSELDTSPSPGLVDLYRQLDQPFPSSQQARPAQNWKIHSSVQVPYVGRGRVLEEIRQAYWDGRGALIFGESGQGKTRLLQEFTALTEPKPRILLASCHQAETNLPFEPLIELFRHQVSAEEWVTLPGEWAGRLHLILPEISSMRAELKMPANHRSLDGYPAETRQLLFEAIRQIFLHLSRKERLLFCLDDAHWSDEATLSTISYLLDRPPFTDQRAFLLLAARIEEQNIHLEDLVTYLQHQPQIRSIHLARMNVEEVRKLAQNVIGFSPPDQFTHQLAIDSGGNPLFILEILRALSITDIPPDGEAPVSLPLPKSIQSLIHTRLNGMAPAARRILEAAAILGSNFDAEILTRVSQYPETKVIATLDELQQRLLVEPQSANPHDHRLRFIHDKIREVLVEEISPAHRRQLHQAAALFLEEKQKGKTAEYAAILAKHYEQGNEPVRAYHYWVEAGRYARQLYTTSEAVRAFSSAQNLIPLLPELLEEDTHNLYAEWTELAYECEDAVTIQKINSELLELGKSHASQLLIGTALDGLSDACMVTNQFADGLNYTNQALPYLEQTQNLYEQMEVYNHRGVFLYMLNQVEEAIDTFQDALALGAGSEDPQVIRAQANAHYQIAVARILKGWPKISLNHALLSLDGFKKVNRPHGQLTSYSALALARYFLGDYRQARKDCQNGIKLAERLQAWRMLGYLHAYRAMIEAASGNLDAAYEHANQAIQLGDRYGHHETSSNAYSVLGDLYSWLESHDRAINSYQRGIEASNNGFLALNPTFRLAHALCRNGSIEAGLKLQEQSAQIAEQAGLGLIRIFIQLSQVIALQILGEWDQVKIEGEKLLEKTVQRSVPTVQIYAQLSLGYAALHEEDLEIALQYFLTAASKSSLLPLPWTEIEAQRQVDGILRLVGRPNPAPRRRILTLLGQIESTATVEPLRQIFSEYQTKMSNTG